MTTVTPEARPAGKDRLVGIIDSDVHPHFAHHFGGDLRRPVALAPYFPREWRERYRVGAICMPPPAHLYPNVTGGARLDAVDPDGGIGTDPRFTAAQLLDPNDIAAAVLISGSLLGLGAVPDPDSAAALASAYNEWMCAEWLEVDDRYRGAIVAAPQDSVLAVKEIERMADRPGMVSIFIPPGGTPLSDRRFYPIYQAAQDHSLPIVIHPSGNENNWVLAPRMALTPTYYLEWHTALGQSFHSGLLSMLCTGVFEHFPELKLIVTEGGFTWAAEMMWRLDREWKQSPQSMPYLKHKPSEYVRRNVRFTTQPLVEPHKPTHLAKVLDMIYAHETLMFSSDYPHWDFDDPSRVLNGRGISSELRRRVFIETPRELYGDRL